MLTQGREGADDEKTVNMKLFSPQKLPFASCTPFLEGHTSCVGTPLVLVTRRFASSLASLSSTS